MDEITQFFLLWWLFSFCNWLLYTLWGRSFNCINILHPNAHQVFITFTVDFFPESLISIVPCLNTPSVLHLYAFSFPTLEVKLLSSFWVREQRRLCKQIINPLWHEGWKQLSKEHPGQRLQKVWIFFAAVILWNRSN